MPIYSIIEEDGGINFYAGYGIEDDINGLTLGGEREIYQDVFGETADDLYHRGGELIGIRSDKIEEMVSIYEHLYEDSLRYGRQKEIDYRGALFFLNLL